MSSEIEGPAGPGSTPHDGRRSSSPPGELDCIITLDYELPAGGRGDVRQHMLQPTEKLLEVCERHGAKLTILAELGEIWAFEDERNAGYGKSLGYDPVAEIERQLVATVSRGHDVQLHLHPQWLGARWSPNGWELDYERYQLGSLDRAEAVAVLRRGREWLEQRLGAVMPEYACLGFRAGNWNIEPAAFYFSVLREAGLRADSSIFKWGYADTGAVTFDYRAAFSNLRAWYLRTGDLSQPGESDGLLEVPIAALRVSPLRMLTWTRLKRAFRYVREDLEVREAVAGQGSSTTRPRSSRWRTWLTPRAKKLDFCKLSGREMLSMLRTFRAQLDGSPPDPVGGDPFAGDAPVPMVMIGHSKQLGAEKNLAQFLRSASEVCDGSLRFSTYREFVQKYTRQSAGVEEKQAEFT